MVADKNKRLYDIAKYDRVARVAKDTWCVVFCMSKPYGATRQHIAVGYYCSSVDEHLRWKQTDAGSNPVNVLKKQSLPRLYVKGI